MRHEHARDPQLEPGMDALPSAFSFDIAQSVRGSDMTDTLSKAARSARMSLVRGKDTKPELWVRRLVHSMGYRYRLHRRSLPGKPDLVFGPRASPSHAPISGCPS